MLPTLRRLDLGPDADAGRRALPPTSGARYRTYVSALDADGNEVAGIRLPDLTVPVATHTGWNPRHPETGGAGQIIDMQGSTLPFPRTPPIARAPATRAGSIDERYRDRDDYLARVRAAAEDLVARRYLLAEDVDTVVAHAAERWDALT